MAMAMQELEIRIKRIQARIKLFRKKINHNQHLNQSNISLYQNLIQSAKHRINTILQIEDDLLSIEYSEYIDIPNIIDS